jgi:hypothetical protein
LTSTACPASSPPKKSVSTLPPVPNDASSEPFFV